MKKSLFLIATEKYTSLPSDLSEMRKLFLDEAVSVAELNKLYSGSKPSTAPKVSPTVTTNTKSNPGGHETPAGSTTTSPTPTSNAEASAMDTLSGFSDVKPITLANGDQVLINTITGEIIVGSDDPNKVVVRNKTDVTQLQKLAVSAKDIFGKSMPTNEDIMSALSTLSTGEVMNTENDILSDDVATDVKPAGDVLVDTEEDEDVEEASAEPMTSTASEQGSGEGSNGSTINGTGQESSWNGLGGSKSPGLAGSETSEATPAGDKTGVDDSYMTETEDDTEEETSETNKGIPKETSKGAGEAPEQTSKAVGPALDNVGDNKDISKGAGELDSTGQVGESEPEVGEDSNPSGKESAFWLPNDDLLGLKDVVGSVAKGNGVPDAQETIGKDANTGALVKKPTTTTHAMPNMRQYVRTNPVPGMPQIPMGGQPVDISDLDSVMGLDSGSDKALNISLNFNF